MRVVLGVLCLAGAAYVLRRHLRAKPPPSKPSLNPWELVAAHMQGVNGMKLRKEG